MNNYTKHKNQIIGLVKSAEYIEVLDIWEEFEWAKSDEPNPLPIEVENIVNMEDELFTFLYLSDEFHEVFTELQDSEVYSLISNNQFILTSTSTKEFSERNPESRALDDPLGFMRGNIEGEPLALDLKEFTFVDYLKMRDDRHIDLFSNVRSEGFYRVLLISPLPIDIKTKEKMIRNRDDLF